MRRLLVATLLLACAAPVLAQSTMPKAELADTQLPDARQERRAKALMETLRCLVCQGQSIADSDADMAADMRALVRREIRAGKQPEEVRAWLISRYGAWVSYKPTTDAVAWPLWAAPLFLLVAGVLVARSSLRRRRR